MKEAIPHFAEPDKWPNPIIAYLNGQLTRQKLLDSAVDNDKKTDVFTYLAMESEVNKHNDDAIANFRWVAKSGNRQFTEYGLALAALAHLDPSFVAPIEDDKSTIQSASSSVSAPLASHDAKETSFGAVVATSPNGANTASDPKSMNNAVAAVSSSTSPSTEATGKTTFSTVEAEQIYVADAGRKIRSHWTKEADGGSVITVTFKVGRGGESSDLIIDTGDANSTAAKRAIAAIEHAAPFRPLPANLSAGIELKATFRAGQSGGVDVGMR